MINFHVHIFETIYNLLLVIEVIKMNIKICLLACNFYWRIIFLSDHFHCIGMYNVFFIPVTIKLNDYYVNKFNYDGYFVAVNISIRLHR